MNSGYGGSPSRALSTMSLSVRPVRNFTSRSITRSQSFTGVNDNKPYRNLSVFSTPGLSRKPSRANRASRMFTMTNMSNPQPKVPQPERLDEVYEALKKGLQSYLQVHQMELDTLNRQMKESKRNSRLGFLYELDKQVKVTERYMRRLEFHLSKIEELYEAYCLQRRLRDGANKMVKAYTAYSPGSKEARECLTEANKGYKEYTENMCVLESELENQLGEFHIKMKGLAGFARLCAGDQYEIFMRYGRQRWKLRGRIEINAKQVWDSEEVVFLPLISDFLCVKVIELKSLANHVVVGNVSCETKDLFAALSQMVAVDINDLGTIKLRLEVTWNPFDKDEQGSVASAVSKAPTVSKRFSTIFNQSPPDTPSLHEQSFYNMLRCREELENGTAWCNSSESSDDSSSPQLSAGALRCSTHKAVVVTPEIQPAGKGSCTPQPEITFCLRDSSSQTPKSTQKLNTLSEDPISAQHEAGTNRIKVEGTEPGKKEEDFGQQPPIADCMTSNHTSHSYLRCLSHISESSSDGVLLTDRAAGKSEVLMSLAPGISINHTGVELPSRSSEPHRSAATDTDISQKGLCGVSENISTEEVTDQDPYRMPQNATSPSPQMDRLRHPKCDALPQSGDVTYVARRVAVEEEQTPRAGDSPVDCGLECALGAVASALDDYRGQFPELQLLEKEVKMLQVTLKGDSSSSRSPSMASLTVETVLGSFDFLNTSDCEDEEEENGDKRNRHGGSLQDRGWDSSSIPTSPLTTGCTSLDCSLVVHLKNCRRQLLRLGMFGPLRCGEMYALDRLLREARVLELIRHIMKDNPRRPRLPTEVIPQLSLCPGAASLWQQCAGQASVYSVSAESFLVMLSTAFSCMLPEKAKSMANTVFQCLVERVLDQKLPQRGSNRNGLIVTLFQLWSYLEANSISDMETHITELAEEVCVVQRLTSCDQDVIIQTLRHPAECCLRKGGIQAVAKLLKDPRGKVSASASSVLRSLATQPRQREQALVSCLELLEDENVDTRVCGCKALSCLKAKESIDHLVYLCRTDKEEVRDAAKQALLVLGEEGKMAHRHVEISQDSLPRLFSPGCMASTAF